LTYWTATERTTPWAYEFQPEATMVTTTNARRALLLAVTLLTMSAGSVRAQQVEAARAGAAAVPTTGHTAISIRSHMKSGALWGLAAGGLLVAVALGDSQESPELATAWSPFLLLTGVSAGLASASVVYVARSALREFNAPRPDLRGRPLEDSVARSHRRWATIGALSTVALAVLSPP
jgi:hypothetical protein